MSDDLFDAVLELVERLLERGVVVVFRSRRTPTGRRLSVGIGLLDPSDGVLLGAVAGRMLRRHEERTRPSQPFEERHREQRHHPSD